MTDSPKPNADRCAYRFHDWDDRLSVCGRPREEHDPSRLQRDKDFLRHAFVPPSATEADVTDDDALAAWVALNGPTKSSGASERAAHFVAGAQWARKIIAADNADVARLVERLREIIAQALEAVRSVHLRRAERILLEIEVPPNATEATLPPVPHIHGRASCCGLAATVAQQQREIERKDAEIGNLRIYLERAAVDTEVWKRGCEDRQREIERIQKTLADEREHFEERIKRLTAQRDAVLRLCSDWQGAGIRGECADEVRRILEGA